MKHWKRYPHLVQKATWEEMDRALDALPRRLEEPFDQGRKAYKKDFYHTLWMMGWEYQEFFQVLVQKEN